MSLKPTVTKVSVVGSGPEGVLLTLNLKVNDGTSDVIDKEYSITYNKRTGSSAEAFEVLMKDMQKDIDAYKYAKTVDDSVQLSTGITNLENNLVV